MSEATTRFLRREVERIEAPLKKLNRAGFESMRRLAVFEQDCVPGTELATNKILYRLALLLRKLGNRHGSGIVADREFKQAASPAE